ncbi:MAG: MFS transporter [Arenicellales bacterium WSBS_2016_MAG_OTU3]
MKKQVLLLSMCQALWMSGMSLMIATSALVGLHLTPEPALITLPLALQFFAGMMTSLPASMLMKHIGRRGGFAIGLGLGIIGAAFCAIAVFVNDFTFFCLGSLLLGINSGFAQFYRFAAADVATEDFKSRAISYVLAGGIVAAFIGPNLAHFTRDVFVGAEFAGGYLAIVALYLVSGVVMFFLNIPMPTAAEKSSGGRPLLEIMAQPTFMVAVLCATVGYGTMNLIMTSTPLAMELHNHAFRSTATVIQLHVLGMYVPSFFTGHLIKRFGVTNILITGSISMLACVVVNLSGYQFHHFWIALVLLGIGWNFLFIGGTTLLTETYTPPEKAKTQGSNDLIVFSIVSLTALSSGFLHHLIGWQAMNQATVPGVLIVTFAAVWLGFKRRNKLAAAGA